ncbi:MAG TPA: TraR/DksA C4-type zinc finger protein [Acidobacteriota bacterium]
MEKHRKQLLKVRQEIVAKMRRTVSDGRDETLWAETSDSADQALSSYTKEFLYKLSDVERGQFVEIEAALQRIGEGTFAECVDCHNPLPSKRLEIVPWASRCTNCQETFERAQEEEQKREEEAVANL